MGRALNYSVIRRFLFLGAGLLIISSLQAEPSTYVTAQSKNLPFPKAIELKVEFWKAIYTKYKVSQGIIHDSEDLSIIYDAVALPRENEMGAVDRVRWQIRENIFNILRKRGANLTTEERAVLAKFPPGVSRARLMRATENIRFQRGQADRFKEGLIRSGLYLKHIEKILQEEGVPDFIKFLPHVESSYQEFAMSKLAAAGLWQLMPTTARMFDLRVEYAVDERLDPWAATRAAARHLKRDFNYLGGSWALALTAYNHGPGGVKRAVKTLGTNDIAEIAFNYESPSFGFASRNFYCQFLAAVEVASNYQYYFGELPIMKTLEFQAVKIDRPTFLSDLGAKYTFNMDEFKKMNPGLRPPVLQNRRPISAGLWVRLPKAAKREVLVAALDRSIGKITAKKSQDISQAEIRRSSPSAAAAAKALIAPKPEVVSKFAVRDLADKRGWIEVEMNETIAQVADWMGTTADDIREWNGMDSGSQIQQSQRLLLKFEAIDPIEFGIAREDYHKQIREDFFARFEVTKTEEYLVKRGENLWSICYQKFDVPPWLLEEYNPKTNISEIKPGTKLKIPQLIEKEFIAVGSTEAGLLQE